MHCWLPLAATIAFLLLGCRGAEAPAPPEPPPVADAEVTAPPVRPPRPRVPACAAELVLGVAVGVVHLTAGATPIALDLEEEDPKKVDVTVWPDGDAHVLVAFARPWFAAGGAHPDGVLWRVPCAEPAAAVRFASLDGADFAQAALSPDGWVLYFSGPTGVGALDLETRAVTTLTSPTPAASDCWVGEGSAQRDLVLSLSPDGHQLTFARGGPCGYEGDWVGHPWVLLEPGDPTRRRERERRPIAALAAVGETVWLSDGGACDEPGVVAPATRGALWRTDDQGASWARVQVAEGTNGLRTHAQRILVDPRTPGRIVTHAARCRVAGEVIGGELFASEDGGASWRHAALPDGLAPLAVEGLNGRLDQVVVWVEGERRFASEDLGRTYTPLDPRPLPPPPTVAPVQLGAIALAPQDDGLYLRTGPGSRPLRVFPPQTP